ncbi:MAG: hypothetical protein IJS14_10680 [Lentisphaeria bacterium]|nr:hypothetical protein [Lentisphaeria bacterium]
MDPTTENPPTVPAPPNRKRRGCLIAVVVVVLAVVVIPAVIFLGTPHRWEIGKIPTSSEMIMMRQVVGKLSTSLVDDDGNMVEKAVVELEPGEIGAILNNMQRMTRKQFREQMPGVFYLTQWKNGAAEVWISYTFGFLAVNSHFELIPAVRDGKLTLTARNCSVGWFPLSSGAVTEGLRKAILELEETHEEYRAAIEAVDSLEVQGDRIRLTLRPKKIQTLLPILLRSIMQK